MCAAEIRSSWPAGLSAKVVKVPDDGGEIDVEIADNVRVKVVRSMIADVRAKGEPVKA